MRNGPAKRVHWRGLASAAVALSCLLARAGNSRADTFTSYVSAGSFSLPSSPLPGATVGFDSTPDGRIVAVVGSSVYRETASGSRAFTVLGTLAGADIASFGVAFVHVSPDGTKIAVGNNGGASVTNFQIGVFSLVSLTGTWISANHFDAAWIDNRMLAVAAGDFVNPSYVYVLDTQSPIPTNPVATIVVSNIGGASSGIAFDASGNLYTADGFAMGGPSLTGAVYAVRSAAWRAALSSGVPVNFETQGIPIVDLLSGDPLGFDGAGDLVVGGANFGTPRDLNYFAIVRASAVQQALAGGGSINPNDTTKVRKLDPDPGADSFYAIDVNRAHTEVYAVSSGAATAYVYRGTPPTPVPALSTWSVALLLLALALAGGRASQRR